MPRKMIKIYLDWEEDKKIYINLTEEECSTFRLIRPCQVKVKNILGCSVRLKRLPTKRIDVEKSHNLF